MSHVVATVAAVVFAQTTEAALIVVEAADQGRLADRAAGNVADETGGGGADAFDRSRTTRKFLDIDAGMQVTGHGVSLAEVGDGFRALCRGRSRSAHGHVGWYAAVLRGIDGPLRTAE
ncbi:MAG: hypothetical protein V9G20_19385, partial [Candidatus Promineifilaceae bacterium]